MYPTLTMMKEKIAEFSPTSPELYKFQQDDRMIAHLYVRHFGILKEFIENEYPMIPLHDKISHVLEEIHQSLLHYDPGKGAKYPTFLMTFIRRRFYALGKQVNSDKRKALNDAMPIEFRPEEGADDLYDLGIPLPDNLTENELKFCRIVMEEPSAIGGSEIARIIGVSPAAIVHIRKRLQQKISLESYAAV